MVIKPILQFPNEKACQLAEPEAVLVIQFMEVMAMNEDEKRKLFKARYGVDYIKRPVIKATKTIDLTGERGKQIVKAETERALRIHKKTFRKLASM